MLSRSRRLAMIKISKVQLKLKDHATSRQSPNIIRMCLVITPKGARKARGLTLPNALQLSMITWFLESQWRIWFWSTISIIVHWGIFWLHSTCLAEQRAVSLRLVASIKVNRVTIFLHQMELKTLQFLVTYTQSRNHCGNNKYPKFLNSVIK